MPDDPKPTDVQEIVNHIENDVVYPASGREIAEACNGMSDVPSEQKEWVKQKKIDDVMFENAGEVEQVLWPNESQVHTMI